MKILIFLKKWPGGVGVAVKNTARELQNQGHEVKVITREEDMGIYSLVRSIFPMRKKVKELMKKEGYDIVYTRDWSITLPLLLPLRLYKKKHFAAFGGFSTGFGGFLQRIVGNMMQRRLISTGDLVKSRFHQAKVIYNGVDTKNFRSIPSIKRIPNSVGFANWKILNGRDLYHYQKIKKACEKLGKTFIVAENLNSSQMVEFYNKIEIFISLPPDFAGFNLVWLEAMSCNVPKILGNAAGIGNKLPIDRVEDFKSIEDALKNLKEKNYPKLINKDFTWEFNVKKLVNLWLGRN